MFKQKKPFSKIVIIIIFVAIAFFSFVVGDVRVTTNTAGSRIETALIMGSFEFSEVKNIEIVRDLEFERSGFAMPYTKIYSGWYKNDEFGKVLLFAYKNTPVYIVVTCEDRVIIVNQMNEALTMRLYEDYMTQMNT